MFVGNVENSTNSNSKALEIFIFIPINEKEKWDLVGAFFVYECELAFIFTFVYLCWLCFLSITLTSDKTPHDQLFSFIALNRWLFFWIILVIACKLENCMLCKKWRKTFWNQREKSIIWWCQLRKPVKFAHHIIGSHLTHHFKMRSMRRLYRVMFTCALLIIQDN